MIKHIVMWKIKDFAEGASKKEICIKLKEELEALKKMIPAVHSIEVGINFSEDAAAYDLVLNSEFMDEKALEEYQRHPEHVKVANYIARVREERILVDYKL